jgi:pimeloyl-ACP methyl ester carboxylesterase
MRMLACALLGALVLGGCVRFHPGPLPGAPADATFVTVDGVHVRYRDVGQGPTVVLLHGFSSSLDIWERVIPVLTRQHRVIAVDLKGFGWTSRPPGDYSPAAQAALVWKVLDARGVRGDVAVVGHSWGTSVALAMALIAPERVRRIALYSAYVYEDQVPSFFLWSRFGGLGEVLFGLYYDQRMEDRAALAYYDPALVTQDRVERIERELSRPGTTAAALASARGQRYADLERRYRSLTMPVLLLWGREDLVTPLAYGERLVRDLPDARLQIYPRCGHIPMVEAHDVTTRDLAEFLAVEGG